MADAEAPVDQPAEEAAADAPTDNAEDQTNVAAENEESQENPPKEEGVSTAEVDTKPDAEPTENQPGEVEAEATEAEPQGENDEEATGEKTEEQPTEGETPAADGEEPPAAEDAEPEADGNNLSPEEENTEETSAEVDGPQPAGDDQKPPEGEGEAATEEASTSKDETGAEGKVKEGGDEEPKTEAEAEADPLEGIPKSDTFADGEKPQSPAPHVGEVLSREGSPKPDAGDEITITPPVPKSPREEQEGEVFDVADLDEDIISPEQDREALVEMYHAAIAEREQFQQQNHQLQHKLAEYFKKKKSDEQKQESVDKNEADQEQRYLKHMSQLEELRSEDQMIREAFASEIEELQRRCQEKQEEVDAHRMKFVEFKHQVALNALNSRSGKPIPPKDVEQYLAAENRKDQEVVGVRLENIKLKNKLKKKEQQLKSKEELAEGLHLIDFEQLKIENQTYNEKIEERNEELLKLRKKITNTVQVLTHLKEKLQYVQGENNLLKSKLKDVESSVAQKRDVLTRTKQARDALRIDNHRLRQSCGLLGNEPLLRDFEERKDEADNLRERLDRLKMQHAELTLNTASVRRKIEQMKSAE